MRIGAFSFLISMVPGLAAPTAAGEALCSLELVTVAPEEFAGTSGKPFGPLEVLAAIRPLRIAGPEGPCAWSIAVAHDLLLDLIQVTADGTSASTLIGWQHAFLRIEVIDPARNGGKAGYVASAALAPEDGSTLPADRIATVISATYRGVFPTVDQPTEKEISFEFVDGLVGTGDPVINTVIVGDTVDRPDLHPLSRKLAIEPSCKAALGLSIVSGGSRRDGDVERLQADVAAGRELVVDAGIVLSSGLSDPEGAEGWSLSVQHDRRAFKLLSAGTAGSDAERFADEEGNFLKTTIVDGDGGAGFYSAAILSMAGRRTLPSSGDFLIAKARYLLTASHEKPGVIAAAPIRFEGGLRQSPVAVDNIISLAGTAQLPCRQAPLLIVVNVTPGGPVFLRGDANADGKVNITDAIWLVESLFYPSTAPPCPAAANSNGDLLLDTSDVIFILSYLFQEGRTIPPPFPDCGHAPQLDDPFACDDAAIPCP